MDKKNARKRLKLLRNAIADRPEKDMAILEHLLSLKEVQAAEAVFLYNAFGSEPSTKEILRSLQEVGKKVCLPRVEGGEMQAVPIGPDTKWRRGAFGIIEPLGKALPAEKIDVVICPGLGFDGRGGRIGYGGGFYDRFLKKTTAMRIGLCYNACIWDCVPVNELDERMHCLVSEAGVIGCWEEQK